MVYTSNQPTVVPLLIPIKVKSVAWNPFVEEAYTTVVPDTGPGKLPVDPPYNIKSVLLLGNMVLVETNVVFPEFAACVNTTNVLLIVTLYVSTPSGIVGKLIVIAVAPAPVYK